MSEEPWEGFDEHWRLIVERAQKGCLESSRELTEEYVRADEVHPAVTEYALGLLNGTEKKPRRRAGGSPISENEHRFQQWYCFHAKKTGQPPTDAQMKVWVEAETHVSDKTRGRWKKSAAEMCALLGDRLVPNAEGLFQRWYLSQHRKPTGAQVRAWLEQWKEYTDKTEDPDRIRVRLARWEKTAAAMYDRSGPARTDSDIQ